MDGNDDNIESGSSSLFFVAISAITTECINDDDKRQRIASLHNIAIGSIDTAAAQAVVGCGISFPGSIGDCVPPF